MSGPGPSRQRGRGQGLGHVVSVHRRGGEALTGERGTTSEGLAGQKGHPPPPALGHLSHPGPGGLTGALNADEWPSCRSAFLAGLELHHVTSFKS